MQQSFFTGTEIIDLCEEIIEFHKALKAVSTIYSEFNFEPENGNAFQGKIQKTWFKSVIEEMVMSQFHRINRIVDLYNSEQEKINTS